MMSDTMVVFAIAGLIALSVGSLVYFTLFSKISNEASQDRRVKQINSRDRTAAVRQNTAKGGRKKKSVQDTLKELEDQQKAKSKTGKSPPLSIRLQRAGLAWSKNHFYMFCAGSGVMFGFLGIILGASPLIAAGLGFVGLVGFPFWFLGFLSKRRQKKFLEELPNSVDVIVRGVKSGLPLNDCMNMIALEAREPVRSEFARIMETQQLGVPLHEAINRLYERMPLAEANFFSIVVSIQQQSGGSLSETLGNLSKVLRDRKKMRGKIVAMSQEAKASAMIIGSLPLVVMGLVYLTSPGYISLLFTTETGNLLLGISAFWMFCGTMVMRQMINFDF
ncbi:MAG: type II secretion system F family protein [Pseudomonadota bacterium]